MPYVIMSIFIVVGLYLLYYEISTYIKENKLYNNGIKAEGIIVGNKEFNSNTGTMYKPTIEFKTADGEKIITTYKYYSYTLNYQRGDKVEVVYNQNKPDNAIIYGDKPKLNRHLQGIIFGVAFSLIGSTTLGLSTGIIEAKPETIAIVALGIFELIGVGLVVLSIVWIIAIKKHHNEGEITEGTVIKNDSTMSRTHKGRLVISYRPTVKFRTPQGQEIIFTYKYSSNLLNYKVGDIVKVVYNQDNPHKATIKSFKGAWSAPLIAISVGILFVAISTLSIILVNYTS